MGDGHTHGRANAMNKITFPWPHKDLNPNSRAHWRVTAKHKKALRMACFTLAHEAKAVVNWDGDVHLWIDFYPPDKRARDQDNMLAAFKAGFDGLADALKVNDKRFRLHPYVKDEIGGMVRVTITDGPALRAIGVVK